MKKEIDLGYIHMESWDPKSKKEIKKSLESLDPSELILLPNNEYTLKIDYPLTNPFIKEFKTENNGMSRLDFINLIVKSYKEIYETENSTSEIERGYIPGMLNRNKTNGDYGIWGHDLGDLMLHTAYIDNNLIEIDCDS